MGSIFPGLDAKRARVIGNYPFGLLLTLLGV